MPYVIPALSDAVNLLVAAGRALFPDRNYGSPRSYHSKRARFFATAMTQLAFQIKRYFDDVMPDTAGDDGPIDRWGGLKGVIRKEATAASKPAAARVRGIAGTAVPLAQELRHPASNLRFQIATATAIPGGGTYVDADIVAIDTGAQTRLSSGQTLVFQATPPGLEGEVVLQLDIDQGGFDREGYGAYRDRVLAAWGQPQSGGNPTDYVAWALQVAGVTSAYAFANRAGIGTVDIVGLHSGSGAARILAPSELTDMIAYLRTLAPGPLATTTGPLRALTVVPDPQPVEIVLTPNGESAYAFDWTGGPLTVASWTAATNALQMTAPLPSSMRAGHRLSLKGVGSAQDGTEYKISAIAAADTVTLEKAPTVAPVATDIAYSGGPLVTPVRSAVLAHLNGETVYAGKRGTPSPESSLASVVGLEVLADGIGPANPAGIYGTWVGGIYLANLIKIAIYKAGVRNYQIVAPVSDYEAADFAYPLDVQIGLVTPSSVLIRGAT